MGQCCSAPAGNRRPPPSGEPPAINRGVTDKSLLPAIQSGGLQLVASSARCAATPAGAAGDGGCTPLLVRHTPQGLFVALFEGLGEDRRSVAAYCRSRAFEVRACMASHSTFVCRRLACPRHAPVPPALLACSKIWPAIPSPLPAQQLFQESSVRHAGAPLEALKETLERLDADILGTERLRHAVRREVEPALGCDDTRALAGGARAAVPCSKCAVLLLPAVCAGC